MNIQELITELTEALDEQENDPESEARLRQELSGISHEVEKMVAEIAQRAQDLVDHEAYRNFIVYRLDKLRGDTAFWGGKFDPDKVILPIPPGEHAKPRTPEKMNRGAERAKKILRSREITELTEHLENYNRKLEFEASRYRERQSELQQKQVQQELLKRRIESLEESPDVKRKRLDLSEAFEAARKEVNAQLPDALTDEFKGWCKRNGFLAGSTLSLEAIAANWKRARVSSSRFDSESTDEVESSWHHSTDAWVLERAFRNYHSLLRGSDPS